MEIRTTRMLLLATLLPGLAAAACDEQSAAQVRESNLGAPAKISMLKGFGCDAADLEQAVASERATTEKQLQQHEAQRRAQDEAARQAKERANQERLTAQVAADNAARDAFDQDMANKCGSYPMQLRIGFSEKLLKMGCAGQAQLVGESKDGRVYQLPGLLVSVQLGGVTRWVAK